MDVIEKVKSEAEELKQVNDQLKELVDVDRRVIQMMKKKLQRKLEIMHMMHIGQKDAR